MPTQRWVPIFVALFTLSVVPFVPANGDGGGGIAPEGCLNIISSDLSSGIHPVLSISDAIAVGLETNTPTEAGAVLVIIPALCHVPSVSDIIGNFEQAPTGGQSGLPVGDGTPTLP